MHRPEGVFTSTKCYLDINEHGAAIDRQTSAGSEVRQSGLHWTEMATLCPGVQYGLSSQQNFGENKDLIFVKLTDSAVRAIYDFIKNQVSLIYDCFYPSPSLQSVAVQLDKSPYSDDLLTYYIISRKQ